LLKRDLRKKGKFHLTQAPADPKQVPVQDDELEDEGPVVEGMRRRKIKEFERYD
jgi:hypothetical protein